MAVLERRTTCSRSHRKALQCRVSWREQMRPLIICHLMIPCVSICVCIALTVFSLDNSEKRNQFVFVWFILIDMLLRRGFMIYAYLRHTFAYWLNMCAMIVWQSLQVRLWRYCATAAIVLSQAAAVTAVTSSDCHWPQAFEAFADGSASAASCWGCLCGLGTSHSKGAKMCTLRSTPWGWLRDEPFDIQLDHL